MRGDEEFFHSRVLVSDYVVKREVWLEVVVRETSSSTICLPVRVGAPVVLIRRHDSQL